LNSRRHVEDFFLPEYYFSDTLLVSVCIGAPLLGALFFVRYTVVRGFNIYCLFIQFWEHTNRKGDAGI
jgi:hypothetical protein